MKRKFLGFGIAFVFVSLAVSSAYAADFLPKDQTNTASVVVGGNKTYKNLYVAGGSVSVNNKILGDLVAAGGSVNIVNSIEKDLIAAGGNVNISAPVGEDVRVAGGNVNISKDVGGDLLLAGGTVSVAPVKIGGDLWVAAGTANLSGKVAGNARIAGKEVFIDGQISGDVNVWASKTLTFGPDSKVLGKIIYHGPKEAVVAEGAQIGAIEFHKAEKHAKNFVGLLTVVFIIKLIALFIGALIVLKLLTKSSGKATGFALARPWKSMGWGIVGLIAIPVVACLLMVSMIGAFLGILLMVWFIFSLIMACLLLVMYLGRMVEKWILRKESPHTTLQSLLWGILAGAILMVIPVVGCIVLALAYLVAYGGILQMVEGKLKEERSA